MDNRPWDQIRFLVPNTDPGLANGRATEPGRGERSLVMPTTEAGPPLGAFRKSADFFVGIDSDGCVFDTMEVKHKECFIPNIVHHYRLASLCRATREVAEFLNLYSRWRGTNRFPGLALTLDLLADRPEVVRRGVKLPDLAGLRAWLARESRWAIPR